MAKMYWGRALILFIAIVSVLYGTEDVWPTVIYKEGGPFRDYSGAYTPYDEGFAAGMASNIDPKLAKDLTGAYQNPGGGTEWSRR